MREMAGFTLLLIVGFKLIELLHSLFHHLPPIRLFDWDMFSDLGPIVAMYVGGVFFDRLARRLPSSDRKRWIWRSPWQEL